MKIYRTFAPDLNKVITVKKEKNIAAQHTFFRTYFLPFFELISVTIIKILDHENRNFRCC
jgi:hypothetical protein